MVQFRFSKNAKKYTVQKIFLEKMNYLGHFFKIKVSCKMCVLPCLFIYIFMVSMTDLAP